MGKSRPGRARVPLVPPDRQKGSGLQPLRGAGRVKLAPMPLKNARTELKSERGEGSAHIQ